MTRQIQTKDQERLPCSECTKNLRMPGPKTKLGFIRYAKYCASCAKKHYGDTRKVYRKIKKPHCERCGFVAEDPCQLDIHHIDRNHKNNIKTNLITLCSNCHRLEHKEDRKIWGTYSKG